MRANASRGSVARSMLACTLNTNAEHGFVPCRRRGRGVAAGARSTMASSRCRTPKLAQAQPAKTGVDALANKDAGPRRRPSLGSILNSLCSSFYVLGAFLGGGAVGGSRPLGGDLAVPCAVRLKRVKMSAAAVDDTPRRSPRRRTIRRATWSRGPRSPIWASIWSSSSSGSMPSCFRKVITCRNGTSNSFSVSGSMPFAKSEHHHARRVHCSTARDRCPGRSPRWPGVSIRGKVLVSSSANL